MGEEKTVEFEILSEDFAYYNTMLRSWTCENGIYEVYIGSSSQDIRSKGKFNYSGNTTYTIQAMCESMIG